MTASLLDQPTVSRASNSPIRINRLISVEEELSDRICREENGRIIFEYCRELSNQLTRNYSENDVAALREKLSTRLTRTLSCSRSQAICLAELALDIAHARVLGTYRRSDNDLRFQIATASGCVRDVSAN